MIKAHYEATAVRMYENMGDKLYSGNRQTCRDLANEDSPWLSVPWDSARHLTSWPKCEQCLHPPKAFNQTHPETHLCRLPSSKLPDSWMHDQQLLSLYR
ncbi:hypothetical protein DNTS_034556 [Danionella cerebrum]|uniref:Uncharacterized protein n=1 Tax=Danionella cerebrum TaxID=2873325 RepID=A0A553QF82_9TELE|nr:hypothetical protein DNTS_034556 [Danionella translucida]